MMKLNLQWFGGRGSGAVRNSYEKAIETLKTPEKSVFQDSKVSPLSYDGSKVMEVSFGDWKKEENFLGIKDVSVKDIVTVQPYVVASKLKNFKDEVDTSSVNVLQIGDKYYLGDGNHRIVSSVLKGKKSVKVRVYKEGE